MVPDVIFSFFLWSAFPLDIGWEIFVSPSCMHRRWAVDHPDTWEWNA